MRRESVESSIAEPPAGSARRWLRVSSSLQVKATVLVVALTILVTAVVSGYVVRATVHLLQQQRDTEALRLTTLVATSAARSLATGQIKQLRLLAEELTDGQSFVFVEFLDPEGRELATVHRSGMTGGGTAIELFPEPPDTVGTPVFRAAAAGVPAFIDVLYPVSRTTGTGQIGRTAAGELVGYVRAGVVPGRWKQALLSELDWLLGVAILAVAGAVPLGFFVVRRIVSPLASLANTMRRFSQGQLDVRSPGRRRDEIGHLEREFNRMADEHERTLGRMVALNEQLERRVTERTEQLEDLAARDPLTGLYNRRHFNEVLERSFSEALRYGKTLSCIMIDLDNFKSINDSFGHQQGDKALILTAKIISCQLRSSDIVARFGGDEYMILLPETDTEEARVLGQRIVETFKEELSVSFPQTSLTISAGVTSAPSPEVPDSEALLRAVDHALYAAKAAGKNQVFAASATVPARRSV